jgi:hypothetical protein
MASVPRVRVVPCLTGVHVMASVAQVIVRLRSPVLARVVRRRGVDRWL